MADIIKYSEERQMRFSHDTLRVQCIYPKYSKPIIDKVDSILNRPTRDSYTRCHGHIDIVRWLDLAQHYGFTDEELDFIINYDSKYRMGGSSDTDDEE